MNSHASPLTEGEIGPTIYRLAAPLLLAFMFMSVQAVAAAAFVERLGTQALAALGYALPIASLVTCVFFGIALGVTSTVARCAGADDLHGVRRLTTDACLLSGITALVLIVGILHTQDALFSWMGARGATIGAAKDYLDAWLVGLTFMALQNTVLAAARGCGEFKTSFQVMLLSAVLNVILDPIFIFGWGPVPALGIVGAGLGAAMTSLCVFALVMRGALTSHGRSLDFHAFGVSQVLQSWRIISSIGAPAVITYLGAPIGWILTMKLVSAFGPTAAAGYTIGDRFHGFFVATVLSLAGALVPIVGQSWGAGRWDRVTSALAIGSRIGIVVGAGFWLSLMLVAVPLVGVLVHDQSVVSATRSFLFIVPAGYAATGFTVMCNAVLNALDRAVSGTLLEVLRSVGLPIPLAWLLGHWFGFHGVMAGLALGSILTVPPAVAIMSRTMRSYRL